MLGSVPMKDGINGRQFFTVKEAAAYCGINPRTLYRLVKLSRSKGGPPHKRFGSAYRFPKPQFIAWAENEEAPR